MAHLDEQTALGIARLIDGELTPEEARDMERRLASDPEAAAWAAFLRESGQLHRDAFAEAAEAFDADALTARILLAVQQEPVRDAELEMLAMARADGERLSEDDDARVEAYLARTPAARRAVDGLGQLGAIHRSAVELTADRVDFARLEERILRAAKTAAPAPSPRVESTRPASRFAELWNSWRTVFLTAAVTAAVMAVVLPGTRTPAPVAPVVHHHTYVVSSMPAARIEQVDYQPGFTGTSHMPANGEGVPVIWFVEEETEPAEEENDLPL